MIKKDKGLSLSRKAAFRTAPLLLLGGALLWAGWPSVSSVILDEPAGSSDNYSSARYNGVAAASGAGTTLLATGDLDDDGVTDLVVGAPDYSSDKGRIYIVYGTGSAPSTTISLSSGTAITGTAAADRFGQALATGDVTGDGVDDLVVGAPGVSSSTGAVYILPGGAQWTSSVVVTSISGLVTVSGGVAGDEVGYSVAVGDLGTSGASEPVAGADELLVGAPGIDATYLFHGPVNTNVLTSAAFAFFDEEGVRSGSSVAILGDVNGDTPTSHNDFAIGAPMANAGSGRAYILGGKNKGDMPGSGSANLLGGSTYNLKRIISGDLVANTSYVGNLGTVVAAGGDVDFDGWADVVLGAPTAPKTSSSTNPQRLEPGRVYIYFGGESQLSNGTTYLSTLKSFYFGVTAYDHLGASISSAGDVDGDGRGDLLVGAPEADHVNTSTTASYGTVYLIPGKPRADWPAGSGTGQEVDDASVNIGFWGKNEGDAAGTSLTGAGDLNDDGYDDFYIGAPGYDVTSGGEGRVYFISFGDFYDEDGDGQSKADADCDDADDVVYVGANEVCDGKDNDCDGDVDDDDDDVLDQNIYYNDSDGDGYGSNLSIFLCADTPPSGYSTLSGDCDDTKAAIKPTATEKCDNVDNDCDDLIDDADENVSGQHIYYKDADLDSYGDEDYASDPNGTKSTCASSPPSGWASNILDCDDSNAAVKPNATERCNEIDDDCDGKIDDQDSGVADQNVYYRDSDVDTYGNKTVTTSTCATTPPSGYVANGDDCDDSAAAIHPGASEICDRKDNDCDGFIDGDDSDLQPNTYYYPDADHDGYGDKNAIATGGCSGSTPDGMVTDHTDCDDTKSSVNPGAAEVCDASDVDENCNGVADDNDSTVTDQRTYYKDNDNDGYGSADSGKQVKCPPAPSKYTTTSGDCDDTSSAVNPGASEKCDGIDNNCDGVIDTDAVDRETYYRDNDKDGYGDPDSPELACQASSSLVVDHTDCDDSAKTVYPNAPEGQSTDTTRNCLVGDGLDNDCDPSTVADQGTCNYDDDGDGFNEYAGDCDDNVVSGPNVYPGAVEICDTIDQDCDKNPTNGFDADGDTYLSQARCSGNPKGDDCNDSDAAIHPNATETCDNQDNDCDGTKDEGFDADEDGHFSAAQCSYGTDCNDKNAGINPDATEVCDGVDWDCDGEKTNGFDEDSDGFPSETRCGDYCSEVVCDCDDFVPEINPDAFESCDDEIDNNCNGEVNESADDDNDGFTNCDGDCNDNLDIVYPGAQEVCDGIDNNCDDVPKGSHPPALDGEVDEDGDSVMICAGDCDDLRADVNPNQTEICDDVDNDCDGESNNIEDVDPGVSGAKSYYPDDDGDEHGDKDSSGVLSCSPVAGHVQGNHDDCDDADASVYAGAPEACDGKDNNCDLVLDQDVDNFDSDEDRYLDAEQCAGFEGVELDCDDNNSKINPGVQEIPGDGIDNNCDGLLTPGNAEFESTSLGCSIGGARSAPPFGASGVWWLLLMPAGMALYRRRSL